MNIVNCFDVMRQILSDIDDVKTIKNIALANRMFNRYMKRSIKTLDETVPYSLLIQFENIEKCSVDTIDHREQLGAILTLCTRLREISITIAGHEPEVKFLKRMIKGYGLSFQKRPQVSLIKISFLSKKYCEIVSLYNNSLITSYLSQDLFRKFNDILKRYVPIKIVTLPHMIEKESLTEYLKALPDLEQINLSICQPHWDVVQNLVDRLKIIQGDDVPIDPIYCKPSQQLKAFRCRVREDLVPNLLLLYPNLTELTIFSHQLRENYNHIFNLYPQINSINLYYYPFDYKQPDEYKIVRGGGIEVVVKFIRH